MLQAQAHVLDPPILQYSAHLEPRKANAYPQPGEEDEEPDPVYFKALAGSWNAGSQRLLDARPLERYAIINLSSSHIGAIKDIVRTLRRSESDDTNI